MAYLIPARGLTGLGRAVSEAASNAFVADLTDQAPDFRGFLVGTRRCIALPAHTHLSDRHPLAANEVESIGSCGA